MNRWAVTGACCVAVAGCGGASVKAIHNVTVNQSNAVGGAKTFSAASMSITFRYPASFRSLPLLGLINTGGNTKNSSGAAVGIDPVNVLIVTRTPVQVLITKETIGQLLPAMDALMTRLAHKPLRGSVVNLDGATGIAYPRVGVPGLAGATSRITYLFVGSDRYEFQCQANKSHLAVTESACDEMLSTLKVSP